MWLSYFHTEKNSGCFFYPLLSEVWLQHHLQDKKFNIRNRKLGNNLDKQTEIKQQSYFKDKH